MPIIPEPPADEKRREMNRKIDAAIAAVEAALRQRSDRREKRDDVAPHSPEHRSGAERRRGLTGTKE